MYYTSRAQVPWGVVHYYYSETAHGHHLYEKTKDIVSVLFMLIVETEIMIII